MKILVTGSRGQVGWELTRSMQPLGEVIALDRTGADLADPQALRALVRKLFPDHASDIAQALAVLSPAEQDLAAGLLRRSKPWAGYAEAARPLRGAIERLIKSKS